jgi:phospholipid/cholesterol/gamma-HCH transport system substrate-binding protein
MATRRRPLRRPRTNQVPPAQVFLRGGIVTALLVGFIALAVTLYSGVPGRSYIDVQAAVPVVGNLIQHDPVRVDGVRVGQVAAVDTTADGRALLKLKLDPGTTLPVDTTVVVRANGLLGGRFVQLVPGRSAQELRDGGNIKAAAESITFGVPETLDTLDAKTRGRLQDMLAGLGTGLAGRGTGLNTFFRRASDEITHAQDLIETTLARPGSVEALLPSLKAGVAPLDANRDDLAALFGATSDALQPFVTERDGVRSLLSAAPPALDAARAGLGNGTRLLAAVRQVADAARRTLPPAPRGLRSAAALLREAGVPLKRTNALLQEASPTVPQVLRVADALRPVLPGLKAASDDLTPMVTTLGAYGCDIVNLGTTFRSMTGSGGTGSGPNGPLKNFRLQAIVPALGEALQTTDHTGLLIKDGYPAPCKYGPTTYPHIPKP